MNAFRAFWPSSRQGKQLAESRSLPEGETQGKNIVILGFGGTGMAVLNAIVRQHSMHGMKLAPSIMAHPNDITIGYRPGSRKAVQQAWQTVKGNFIDDLGPTDNPILAEVFELGRGSDSWLDALVEFIPINSSEMRQKMKQAHIIINTTPVGMDKESKDTAAVKNLNGVFKRKPGEYLVVIDVIHRSTQGKPLATYFLRQAWRQGARAVYNGVDMWLENTVLLTLSSLRDIAELKPKSKRYAAEEEAFARQVYGYSMQASQFAEAADLIEASGRRTRQNKKEKLDWMVKRRNEIIDQAASSAIAASAAERKKIELAAAITRRVLAPYKDLNSMYHCPMHAMLTIYILARMGILALAAYSKQHGHLCPMVTATRDLVDVFPQRAQPASRDKNQAVMIISRQSSQKNPYYRSFKPLENNSGMVRRFKAYLDSVVLHCYQPVIDEILEKSRGRRPGSKNFDFEIIISQAEVKNSLVPALVQRNDDYADAVIDSLLKAMDTAGEKEKAGFSRKLELVIALHSEGPGRQPGPGRSSSSARSSTTLSEKVSQLQRDFQWKAPRPFKDCLSPELIAEWIAIAGRGEVELDRVISVFYRTRRGDSNLENSLFSQALSRLSSEIASYALQKPSRTSRRHPPLAGSSPAANSSEPGSVKKASSSGAKGDEALSVINSKLTASVLSRAPPSVPNVRIFNRTGTKDSDNNRLREGLEGVTFSVAGGAHSPLAADIYKNKANSFLQRDPTFSNSNPNKAKRYPEIIRWGSLAAIPATAILLSFYFGNWYVAVVSSSFIGGLILKAVVGGISRGCGMYINQAIRGESIEWGKVGRWSIAGAFYLGLIVFGAWYGILTMFVVNNFLKVFLDITLFAALIGLPTNFLIHKYFVCLNREKVDIKDTLKYFVRLYIFNALWWGIGLGIGWSYWPQYIVLIAANMALVWSGILIYLLDSWLKRGFREVVDSTQYALRDTHNAQGASFSSEPGSEEKMTKDKQDLPASSSPARVTIRVFRGYGDMVKFLRGIKRAASNTLVVMAVHVPRNKALQRLLLSNNIFNSQVDAKFQELEMGNAVNIGRKVEEYFRGLKTETIQVVLYGSAWSVCVQAALEAIYRSGKKVDIFIPWNLVRGSVYVDPPVTVVDVRNASKEEITFSLNGFRRHSEVNAYVFDQDKAANHDGSNIALKEASSPGKNIIKVCSLNQLVLPSPERLGKMEKDIAAVKPDILFLQEVTEQRGQKGRGGYNTAVQMAALFWGKQPRFGYEEHFTRDISNGREGIAIVWNTTLRRINNKRYCCQLPGQGNRHLLGVALEIKATGQRLYVFTTHFDLIDADANDRRQQLARSTAYIDEHILSKDPDALIILGGDFNYWDSTEIKSAASQLGLYGFIDSEERVYPDRYAVTFDPKSQNPFVSDDDRNKWPVRSCDRIYVRSGTHNITITDHAVICNRPGQWISDHNLVYTTVRFNAVNASSISPNTPPQKVTRSSSSGANGQRPEELMKNLTLALHLFPCAKIQEILSRPEDNFTAPKVDFTRKYEPAIEIYHMRALNIVQYANKFTTFRLLDDQRELIAHLSIHIEGPRAHLRFGLNDKLQRQGIGIYWFQNILTPYLLSLGVRTVWTYWVCDYTGGYKETLNRLGFHFDEVAAPEDSAICYKAYKSIASSSAEQRKVSDVDVLGWIDEAEDAEKVKQQAQEEFIKRVTQAQRVGGPNRVLLGILEKLETPALRLKSPNPASSPGVDVNSVMREAISNRGIQLAFTAKGLQINVQYYKGKLPKLVIDRSKLKSVISDILWNAIEHSPYEGKLTIIISLKGQNPAKRKIVISIFNQGEGLNIEQILQSAIDNSIIAPVGTIGLSVPQQAKLAANLAFEDNVTTKRGEVGGKGLFFARRDIQNYGGKIELHSSPGVGVAVEIILPVKPNKNSRTGSLVLNSSEPGSVKKASSSSGRFDAITDQFAPPFANTLIVQERSEAKKQTRLLLAVKMSELSASQKEKVIKLLESWPMTCQALLAATARGVAKSKLNTISAFVEATRQHARRIRDGDASRELFLALKLKNSLQRRASSTAHTRILCVGDSLTAGVGSLNTGGYRGPLRDLLGEGYEFVGKYYDQRTNLKHYGSSGDKTDQMLDRMQPKDLQELLPVYDGHTIVLFLGGANDIWYGVNPTATLSDIKQIITNIIKHSRDKGFSVSIYVGAVFPQIQQSELEIKQFNQKLPAAIEQWKRQLGFEQIIFVDTHHAIVPKGNDGSWRRG
ncbi:MAG: endonuclease/exonuclease/phosphatase family protein, partial [Candidatus Omnitrophica bacterium]|nr:endonuclease/exonuclease/phosphatase family protein [Candidatus Omnitrophota bacterium]